MTATSRPPAGSPAGAAPPMVVVDLDAPRGSAPDIHDDAPAAVVVGVTADPDPYGHDAATSCDVVLPAGGPELDALSSTVTRNPLASVALALLLRGSEDRSIPEGLLVESATYSTLQSGPEFAAWLANRGRRDRPDDGTTIAIARDGGTLTVTLDRPAVRNALNAAMSVALIDALAVAAVDPEIRAVHLRGNGPSFCSGGDLDEFGTFVDPATAHLLRIERSVGRAIAAVADRVTAHLHGACAGSGIELPAFAGRVVADPSTTFALPEVSLGLVPGAGGTVSLPRRIGRLRTAQLALCGGPIDAQLALAWGLIDAIEPVTPRDGA